MVKTKEMSTITLSTTSIQLVKNSLGLEHKEGTRCRSCRAIQVQNRGEGMLVNAKGMAEKGWVTTPEALYHRDDALLYIAYVMLIWAASIPADRWHCSLWP